MKKIYVIAHTHWDYEWYFSRQEARVQFAYHMNEVLEALKSHQLEYYMLDGQMAIVDDYLQTNPDKKDAIKKYNRAGRLLLGPWYTQIDEFTTSGESAVRNLQLGMNLANELGEPMKIGYLPDSFGQSQDMPKIYNGFGIHNAVFWRGLPYENKAREFKWRSNDGSEVYTVNIKNGYYVGGELINCQNYQQLINKIATDSLHQNLALPVGGDQRAVDFNLKDKIEDANRNVKNAYLKESSYPQFFRELKSEGRIVPVYQGEYVDPSVSKIHRGIYSSRYDLKQVYDRLERILTYQVEPLMAYAKFRGIASQIGIVKDLWKTVARGQAHDSAGGCNSDKTNDDIFHRGIVALQTANAVRDYLLRKLSISDLNRADLYLYNPLPFHVKRVSEIKISTKFPHFDLIDEDGNKIEYDVLNQQIENAALLRRNHAEMEDEKYYVTRIAVELDLRETGLRRIRIKEKKQHFEMKETQKIQNDRLKIVMIDGKLQLEDVESEKNYSNFLFFVDQGDEGDNYDYSPAFNDWRLDLDFKDAEVKCTTGKVISKMQIRGSWQLPSDLEARKNRVKNEKLKYFVELTLDKESPQIGFKMKVKNTVKDHRLRLVINADLPSEYSYADTQFGVIQRDVVDPHLTNWKEIGYHEEPTALRPMLHFANLHNDQRSITFLTHGMKSYEVIGENFDQLAITLYRSVGFLGRPDMKRRPGDASGLERHETPTPDSQLQKELTFDGEILLDKRFDPRKIQQQYLVHTTQNELYYQCQEINRYVTPLEYFSCNPVKLKSFKNEVDLQDSECVLSSWKLTTDETGYELRIYNPNSNLCKGGRLIFKSPKTVAKLDLNGKIKEVLASDVSSYDILDVEKGKIITLGIF